MIITKHENQLQEKYTKFFITCVKPDENYVIPENNYAQPRENQHWKF